MTNSVVAEMSLNYKPQGKGSHEPKSLPFLKNETFGCFKQHITYLSMCEKTHIELYLGSKYSYTL